MTALSLGTVWEEALAFMRRETTLLLPVALATFGAAQLLLTLGMGQPSNPPQPGEGPAPLLLIPAMLLMLYGNLAITRMTLRPGSSVAECLAASGRNLGRAIGSWLIAGAVIAGITLILVVAAALAATLFQSDPGSVSRHVVLLMLIPMFIVAVRLMLLIPVLAVEETGAVASLRRAWNLSRNHFPRLLAVTALMVIVTLVLGMAQMFVFGSLFRLLSLGIGYAEIVGLIESIVNAAVASLISAALSVFIAMIYRQLAAPQG